MELRRYTVVECIEDWDSTEENKLLNKVVIFVFYAHKKIDKMKVEPLISHELFYKCEKTLGFHQKYRN